MPLANPMNMSTAAVSDMTLESSAAAAMNASTISRESPLVRFMSNTTRRMPELVCLSTAEREKAAIR